MYFTLFILLFFFQYYFKKLRHIKNCICYFKNAFLDYCYRNLHLINNGEFRIEIKSIHNLNLLKITTFQKTICEHEVEFPLNIIYYRNLFKS